MEEVEVDAEDKNLSGDIDRLVITMSVFFETREVTEVESKTELIEETSTLPSNPAPSDGLPE